MGSSKAQVPDGDGNRSDACAVSVYSSRESSDVLAQTLRCCLWATTGMNASVDVIVNGNPSLASIAANLPVVRATVGGKIRLRVWNVMLGDKAFAWNEYVHRLAPPAQTYVFIDGYVQVEEGSLKRMSQILQNADNALAATGLPTTGWSAAKVSASMRRNGGIHGNLYALKANAMAEFRRIGFKLPLGLYRTDSTLGAALAFGLNLFAREWRPLERILIDDQVAWRIKPLAWWRPDDLLTFYRRRKRQGHGQLENKAVSDVFAVRRMPFESLPGTTAELVGDWVKSRPDEAQAMLARSDLARRALRVLQEERCWALAKKMPECVFDSSQALKTSDVSVN